MVNEKAVNVADAKNGALGPKRCESGYEVRAEIKEAPLPATRPRASDTPRPWDLKKRTMIVSWTTASGLTPRPNMNIPRVMMRTLFQRCPTRRVACPEVVVRVCCLHVCNWATDL